MANRIVEDEIPTMVPLVVEDMEFPTMIPLTVEESTTTESTTVRDMEEDLDEIPISATNSAFNPAPPSTYSDLSDLPDENVSKNSSNSPHSCFRSHHLLPSQETLTKLTRSTRDHYCSCIR